MLSVFNKILPKLVFKIKIDTSYLILNIMDNLFNNIFTCCNKSNKSKIINDKSHNINKSYNKNKLIRRGIHSKFSNIQENEVLLSNGEEKVNNEEEIVNKEEKINKLSNEEEIVKELSNEQEIVKELSNEQEIVNELIYKMNIKTEKKKISI